MKKIILTLLGLCLLFSSSAMAAGAGQYFKGNGGYGKIANADFHDLDYTKDFSIEAVIDVKPYENKNRWSGVITKTSSVGLYNNLYAGWGLGVDQHGGYGAVIYAKVGDGTNHISATNGAIYTGRLHLIMTWDMEMKTVTLYLNGVQVTKQSNTSIVPANIDNAYDFWAAKSFTNLTSPIIYSRLWNRDISSDVTTLYGYYNSTKQHELPSEFNKADLISEWLMFEESNVSGCIGTTHLKDTMGVNHIEMISGADVVMGAGDISLSFPGQGAVNQNKAVTLSVSGGYGTLSSQGTIKGPLQYYFQIDESNSFDSANLKESGWIADFLTWQPLLKSSTTYYWRVKTRDSNLTPLESAYTAIGVFSTQGAVNWYVRPAGGSYGLEDGTSYDNAWDGLQKVVWGEDGVEAGDTLYVSGLHIKELTTSSYIATQADIYVNASGFSDEYPITICGNPDDPAIIWGAYKISYNPWNGPDADGVYNITLVGNHYEDWFFEDVTKDSFKVLDKKASIAEVGSNPGSFYLKDKILYVKTSDSANPTGRILANRYGYNFRIGTDKYLKFYNFKWYQSHWQGANSYDSNERCSHIRWEGITAAYGEHSIFGFGDYVNYMQVIECDLSWVSNAIYNISTTNNAPGYYLYKGNYIHDIGVRQANQNGDAHAFGIQGGHDGIIEDNIVENCGTGPLLYAFTNQELKNTIVRRNIIKDLHNLGGATGYGISTQCNNDSLSDKSGNKFYQNIVINAGIGYRFQFEDEQQVYNNIAYNCNTGFVSTRNYHGQGAHVVFKNNMVINSKSYHISWYSGAADYVLDFDNNLYYSTVPVKFKLGANEYTTLEQWKALSKTGCVFDPNSLYADPVFVAAETDNFHVSLDSPSIDKGVDVGLANDPDGTAIPQGNGVDIGVYEYKPGQKSIEGDVDGDGDVDIFDLQLCVNYVLSGEYNEAADLDSNGEVNLIDVQIIVNKILLI